jgi:hypothetical protein
MTQNVVPFPGSPHPLGQYVRVGYSNHSLLEHLAQAGRLPSNRFVFSASDVVRQRDLISCLRNRGDELVLDLNVAELSSVGKWDGAARSAPWARQDRMLAEADFEGVAGQRLADQFAEFAVKHGVGTVLAPTHFIDGPADRYLAIDHASCLALRRALDRAGGSRVRIDYTLITTNSVIKDAANREVFLRWLETLPFDCLWLRTSGFGINATGVGLRKHMNVAYDFHRLRRPIVVDGVGGLIGLAFVAFGAASGISYGVAENERFDASSWRKPRQGGGGHGKRFLFADADLFVSEPQAQMLMAAPHGRRLLGCADPTCCPHGFDDTMRDPKGHFLRQRFARLDTIAKVPEAHRARHFLDATLPAASRVARRSATLRVNDAELVSKIRAHAERLDKVSEVLEDLHAALSTSDLPVAARIPRFAPQHSPDQRA